MNDMSLSRLYRRLLCARARHAVDAAGLDAAALVEAVATGAGSDAQVSADSEAVVALLAVSPPHADLARLLRALRPASEALAGNLGQGRRIVHPARLRDQRLAASGRRAQVRRPATGRLRWAGGIAATFALVFGLWAWHGQQTQRWSDVAASATTSPTRDRIFTSRDRIFASSTDAGAHARSSDKLFQGSFSAGG